jgi:hypothetical protein
MRRLAYNQTTRSIKFMFTSKTGLLPPVFMATLIPKSLALGVLVVGTQRLQSPLSWRCIKNFSPHVIVYARVRIIASCACDSLPVVELIWQGLPPDKNPDFLSFRRAFYNIATGDPSSLSSTAIPRRTHLVFVSHPIYFLILLSSSLQLHILRATYQKTTRVISFLRRKCFGAQAASMRGVAAGIIFILTSHESMTHVTAYLGGQVMMSRLLALHCPTNSMKSKKFHRMLYC